MLGRYLKIGELASLAGVTVRTLRHYDQLGLLRPARITESGHRLYDIQSVAQLYSILAMKELGLSLSEILELTTAKDVDVLAVLEMHRARLQEEMARRQVLMAKLLKVKQALEEHGQPSLEDFREVLTAIHASADRYLSREQFEQLKERYVANAGSDLASGWLTFIGKLRNCYEQRLPKTHPDAMECVAYWKAVADRFVGDHPELRKAVWSFHASRERGRLNYGLTDELYQYLRQLME